MISPKLHLKVDSISIAFRIVAEIPYFTVSSKIAVGRLRIALNADETQTNGYYSVIRDCTSRAWARAGSSPDRAWARGPYRPRALRAHCSFKMTHIRAKSIKI